MTDQPQDEPVSTCGRGMHQAEPKEITITQRKAQNVSEDPQYKPGHERAKPIGIHLYRLLQVRIRRERFPLKAELDRRKGLASEDHPADPMDQFMDSHTQQDRQEKNGRVPGQAQSFHAMQQNEEKELYDDHRNTDEHDNDIRSRYGNGKVAFVFHQGLAASFDTL